MSEHNSKTCPKCGNDRTVEISTYFMRICPQCGNKYPWKLKEGQAPRGYSVCPTKLDQVTEK